MLHEPVVNGIAIPTKIWWKKHQTIINLSFTVILMKIYTLLKRLVNASSARYRGNPTFVLILSTGTNLSIPLNLNDNFTLARRLMSLLSVPFSPLSNPIGVISVKGVFHVLFLILNYVSIHKTLHLCVVAYPVTVSTRVRK